jgi:hypothetical protein
LSYEVNKAALVEGTPMSDRVYICYAREDQEFVLQLATKLKDVGVLVWLDQWDIPPGADWDHAIDNALHDCTRFLIVLSPEAIASKEVKGELQTALALDKILVPVLRVQCQLPRRLRSIQYADFTNRTPNDKNALNQVVRALQGSSSLPQREVKNLPLQGSTGSAINKIYVIK